MTWETSPARVIVWSVDIWSFFQFRDKCTSGLDSAGFIHIEGRDKG